MHVADADAVKLLLTCEHDLVQGEMYKGYIAVQVLYLPISFAFMASLPHAHEPLVNVLLLVALLTTTSVRQHFLLGLYCYPAIFWLCVT